LEKLRSLLHGQCLSGVAHADQWMALARVAGVPHGDGDATPQLASSHSHTPGRKKRNIGVKKLALTAMANLGGQANSKELRMEIARMPESSTLSSETAPESPGFTLWEKTVRGNMGMWFERTETPRVYRLPGSGDGTRPVSWSIYKKRNIGLKLSGLATALSQPTTPTVAAPRCEPALWTCSAVWVFVLVLLLATMRCQPAFFIWAIYYNISHRNI